MGRVLAKVSVLVDVEAVVGVYQTPTKLVKTETVVMPNVEMDTVEIKDVSLFGGMQDNVVIPDWGKGSFDIASSLYKNLTYYDALFAICNLKKTAITTPFAGFTFSPDTHATKTASIDIVMPDRKFKYKGAKSNFKMSGKVGDKVNVTFSVQAGYVERIIAAQTIVSLPREEIMVVRRIGGMSINGVEVNMSEFDFDMGAILNHEKFTNISEIDLTDYAPKLTIKTRLEDGGSDGFDELVNGESMSFVADLKDVAGDVIWRLEIPKAKIVKQPGFEDSSGIFVISREYNAIATDGDDNFALSYFTH